MSIKSPFTSTLVHSTSTLIEGSSTADRSHPDPDSDNNSLLPYTHWAIKSPDPLFRLPTLSFPILRLRNSIRDCLKSEFRLASQELGGSSLAYSETKSVILTESLRSVQLWWSGVAKDLLSLQVERVMNVSKPVLSCSLNGVLMSMVVETESAPDLCRGKPANFF